MGDATADGRGLVLVGPGAAFGVEMLRRFADEGFALGVVSRSDDTVARVADALAADGVKVLGEVADVADPAAFGGALNRLAIGVGGLTCLVYNAKLSIRGAALATSPDALAATLGVNVTGAFAAVTGAIPLLEGRPDATVLITGGGRRGPGLGDGGRFSLSVGKAALGAMSASLTPPLRRRGVRLRTVELAGAVGPDGPLRPGAVAEFFWQAFAAPHGTTFRLTPPRRRAQLSFDVDVDVDVDV
jgi:NAD(P)-dependent dehydrogenase (short-subunit alcohol dehydrogenase family)